MPEDDDVPILGDIIDEPTQYAVASSPTPENKERPPTKPMDKKRIWLFVGIGIAVIVIAGGIFFFLTRAKISQAPSPAAISSAPPVAPVAPQAKPGITIGVQKMKSGLRLVVQWQNLPDGTVKINIFRAASEAGNGILIGSVSVAPSSPVNGNATLNIPIADQGGYYYGVAAGDDGSPLYDSPPAPPAIISPTSSASSSPPGSGSGTPPPSPGTPGGNPPPENGNPPPGNGNGASTTNGGNGNEGTSTGGNTSTIIYYNPEGGISGTASSSPSGNFLVQHVDQKIQIGWQSLPDGTAKIVVSRSSADSGPWTAVLTETDIITYGRYSIQVVDDTLGAPYYYKMDVYDDKNNITVTYGPLLLQPL